MDMGNGKKARSREVGRKESEFVHVNVCARVGAGAGGSGMVAALGSPIPCQLWAPARGAWWVYSVLRLLVHLNQSD